MTPQQHQRPRHQKLDIIRMSSNGNGSRHSVNLALNFVSRSIV
jgi:hypothetical protein